MAASPAPSPLDLGHDAGSRSRPGTVEAGERSSRYRQRHEQVSALDDDHPATIWTGDTRGTGAMTVSLRWTPLRTRTGLPRPANIHLGCLWQALDGAAGVIQQHGGSVSGTGRAGRQVLRLVGRDERAEQTIFVDLATLATFKRFFVFVYGLHRSPEWDLLRPVVAVTTRGGEELTIRLGQPPEDARTCIAVSFHVVGDDLVIRRENDFVDGPQATAAARYGWSLEWNEDGTAPRDAG
ncbi:hypothetical protein [Parafrankia sp. FMc2]|uniref:hypothetical protein n=1 Tax=Parafrankia sp. FMc2 TaxID=3233196 RepID=UPI0034D6D438